jgi:hypothetical protein
LSDQIAKGEYIDVCVVRDTQQARTHSERYWLELSPSPTCTVDRELFSCGGTAIWLEASLLSATNEVWIKNIEGRSLARGQAFAEKTYAQINSLTPECHAVVLYNIINGNLKSHVEKFRLNTGWHVSADGTLLRGLPKIGFSHLVGFENSGLSIRASKTASAA